MKGLQYATVHIEDCEGWWLQWSVVRAKLTGREFVCLFSGPPGQLRKAP